MRKKAFAKLNIYLKLIKKRDIYHELQSRFVRYDKLYDDIFFEDKNSDEEFELVGNFGCKKQDNTITKAYSVLKDNGFKNELEEFFKTKRVRVEKRIPEFAGLGGGSSDSAGFLLLCNDVLNLGLSKNQLVKIGLKVGADVPFFLHEVKSANVSGIGEVIEQIDDDIREIELILPDVKCSTPAVYRAFRENFKIFNPAWRNCSSKMLLESFKNDYLNDLLNPAVSLYPKLNDFAQKGYFLSGSGSCMFKVKNG